MEEGNESSFENYHTVFKNDVNVKSLNLKVKIYNWEQIKLNDHEKFRCKNEIQIDGNFLVQSQLKILLSVNGSNIRIYSFSN